MRPQHNKSTPQSPNTHTHMLSVYISFLSPHHLATNDLFSILILLLRMPTESGFSHQHNAFEIHLYCTVYQSCRLNKERHYSQGLSQ